MGAGYDSYSLSPEWHIETGGYRETKGNVWQIEDYMEAYLTQGAEISVNDEYEDD